MVEGQEAQEEEHCDCRMVQHNFIQAAVSNGGWSVDVTMRQKVERRGDLEKGHRRMRKEVKADTHKNSGKKTEERRGEATCSQKIPFYTAVASLGWGED